MIVIAFSWNVSSVDEWHGFVDQLEVLKALEPLWREPLKLHKHHAADFPSTEQFRSFWLSPYDTAVVCLLVLSSFDQRRRRRETDI